MSCNIGSVVGKGSQRESIFVQILGLGDERENKITATNIVRQIAKELTAEGIVAHVLNDGASIGIGMGLEQLLRSRLGKSAQEYGFDVVLPCGIDNSFMRKDGIPHAIRGAGHSQQKPENQTRGQ
jgi:hypothetical protein